MMSSERCPEAGREIEDPPVIKVDRLVPPCYFVEDESLRVDRGSCRGENYTQMILRRITLLEWTGRGSSSLLLPRGERSSIHALCSCRRDEDAEE